MVLAGAPRIGGSNFVPVFFFMLDQLRPADFSVKVEGFLLSVFSVAVTAKIDTDVTNATAAKATIFLIYFPMCD